MHALTPVQKHVGDLRCTPKSRLTLGGCSWRQYNRVRAGCSVFALAWKCEHAVCQTAQEWHMKRWRHCRNADPCAARLHKLCHAGRCVFQSSQLGNLEPLTDVAHGHGIQQAEFDHEVALPLSLGAVLLRLRLLRGATPDLLGQTLRQRRAPRLQNQKSALGLHCRCRENGLEVVEAKLGEAARSRRCSEEVVPEWGLPPPVGDNLNLLVHLLQHARGTLPIFRVLLLQRGSLLLRLLSALLHLLIELLVLSKHLFVRPVSFQGFLLRALLLRLSLHPRRLPLDLVGSPLLLQPGRRSLVLSPSLILLSLRHFLCLLGCLLPFGNEILLLAIQLVVQ
mmetsp:Transcript_48271/g.124319  ORF Transcript_48271/g.124319 Transcript_48271/m.124319 type:complete len:337 (-) Transcript_48271:238-1248(-)